MSFHQTDYHYSTDGRFGTVNYKGVEQRYTRIDDDKWNDYRNQGDEGEDDFFAGGWEQKDMEDRRDEAAKKAKAEYERREKIRADIDRNTSNIAKNASAIGNSPEAQAAAQEAAKQKALEHSAQIQQAKARVQAQEANIESGKSQLYNQTQNNQSVKDQIDELKARGSNPFGGQFQSRIDDANSSAAGDEARNKALNSMNQSLGHVHQHGHISDPKNPYSLGEGSSPSGPAYEFADQYKLDLISSGATKTDKNKAAFLANK